MFHCIYDCFIAVSLLFHFCCKGFKFCSQRSLSFIPPLGHISRFEPLLRVTLSTDYRYFPQRRSKHHTAKHFKRLHTPMELHPNILFTLISTFQPPPIVCFHPEYALFSPSTTILKKKLYVRRDGFSWPIYSILPLDFSRQHSNKLKATI